MNWHQYVQICVRDSFYAVFAAAPLFLAFAMFWQKKLAAQLVQHYRDAVERQCGVSPDHYRTLPEIQRILSRLDAILSDRNAIPEDLRETLQIVMRNKRIWYVLFAALMALVLLNIYLANSA